MESFPINSHLFIAGVRTVSPGRQGVVDTNVNVLDSGDDREEDGMMLDEPRTRRRGAKQATARAKGAAKVKSSKK
jgi:hypothetical protein